MRSIEILHVKVLDLRKNKTLNYSKGQLTLPHFQKISCSGCTGRRYPVPCKPRSRGLSTATGWIAGPRQN